MKLLNSKRWLLVCLGALMLSGVQAQKGEEYFQGRIGFGMHSLSYTLQNGTREGQGGYGFELGYGRFLTNQIGLQVGLGVERYGSTSTIDYKQVTPSVVDKGGDVYEFRTSYQQWKEQQSISYLMIPLEGFYRRTAGKRLSVELLAGLKVGIPVSSRYESKSGSFSTSGYYSQWNVELQDLPALGFDSYTGPYSGSLNPGLSVSGLVEVGCLYNAHENYDLYLGAYLSSGFNNVISNSEDHSIYTPEGIYKGVFGSDQTQKVKPVAIGVKMGIQWHRKKK